MKTNAARILEGLGIAYTLRSTRWIRKTFRHQGGAEDRTAGGAGFQDAAHITGPEQYAFAVIPGDAELDFKKLARAAGARKTEMVSLKDVQPLTGYIRGGVTVFGAKRTSRFSPMRRSSCSI